MKKRGSAFVLVFVICCVFLTACGSPSGTYKKIESGRGISLFALSDEITFKGSEVTYTLTFGEVTSKFEVDDEKITVYYSGIGMSADYRKDGKYIYIGESKWEKD